MKKTLDMLPEYSEQAIIKELQQIAKQVNKDTVSMADLEKFGRVSYQTIMKKFPGGLSNALKRAGLKYKEDNRFQPNEVLLKELQRVWELVLKKEGRRPYRSDLREYGCKFCYTTYKDRFGSWLKACQTLLDWEEGEVELKEEKKIVTTKSKHNNNTRNIPLKIRMEILKRDSFRCVYCGRSPATNIGVQLEIDHIHPFSKGGSSGIENLQALCQECNNGKGNQKITEE